MAMCAQMRSAAPAKLAFRITNSFMRMQCIGRGADCHISAWFANCGLPCGCSMRNLRAMGDEIQIKLSRLGTFLDRHRLDGVLLRQRNNFAWITGGKDNHIPNNQSAGVASIFATRSARVCITNNIEAVRMRDEELAGMGIEIREYP